MNIVADGLADVDSAIAAANGLKQMIIGGFLLPCLESMLGDHRRWRVDNDFFVSRWPVLLRADGSIPASRRGKTRVGAACDATDC